MEGKVDQVLRRSLEILSRNVILKRRLTEEFGGGVMYISPAARLKYWKPNIVSQERFLFDMAKLLVSPADVVWDIGANAGVFSVAASSVAGPTGRILAFEADSWLVNLVLRTARSLGAQYSMIDVINVAVASELGFADFAIAARSRASNFLVSAGGSDQAGGVRSTYRVLTIGLDSMLSITLPPKVIKIDIEGAELMALRGGTRIVNEIRPRILCEVDKKNAEGIRDLFLKGNYRIYDAENSGRRPVPTDMPTLNTLFLPSEDPLNQSLKN